MIPGVFHHAIQIDGAKCIGCIHCMRVCPTEAIRIREGKAKMPDCLFFQQRWQKEGKIGVEKAFLNLEIRWGEGRFNADCNKRGRRNEGF